MNMSFAGINNNYSINYGKTKIPGKKQKSGMINKTVPFVIGAAGAGIAISVINPSKTQKVLNIAKEKIIGIKSNVFKKIHEFTAPKPSITYEEANKNIKNAINDYFEKTAK